MAGISLTEKEHKKLVIIQSAIEGRITNSSAGKQLNLSVRQIQRIKSDIKKNGLLLSIN